MNERTHPRTSIGLTRRKTEIKELSLPPIINTARKHPGTAAILAEQKRLAGELGIQTDKTFEEHFSNFSGEGRISNPSEVNMGDVETHGHAKEDAQSEAYERNSLFSRSPTAVPEDPGPIQDAIELDSISLQQLEVSAAAGLLILRDAYVSYREYMPSLPLDSELPDIMSSFHPTMHVSPFIPTAPTIPGTPVSPRSSWNCQAANIKRQLGMRMTPHPEEETDEAE